MLRRLTRFRSLSEGRIRSGIFRSGESRQQDRLLGSLSHAALFNQDGHGASSFFMPGSSAYPPPGTNHSTFFRSRCRSECAQIYPPPETNASKYTVTICGFRFESCRERWPAALQCVIQSHLPVVSLRDNQELWETVRTIAFGAA
jgi:hypothetical protein